MNLALKKHRQFAPFDDQRVRLGLNKMNRRKTLEDTPAVRGMIDKISHLVRVVDES